MNENTNTVETAKDDYPELLPEGWSGAEGEDIFNPATWGVTELPGGVDGDEPDTEEDAEEDEETPTTDDPDDTSKTGAGDDEESPTTATDSEDGKLHFTANIDHKEESVALDPAELPTIYQKAQALDRYQTRVRELEAELGRFDKIAKGLNYADRSAMHDGIIDNIVQTYMDEHPGVPDDMARDYVTRKFALEKLPAAEDAKPAEESGRDYRAEVAELFRAFPDARNERIPDEVTNNAVALGRPLLQVYMDYKLKQTSAKAKTAEKENKILRQNAAAAQKAPVRRSTGGGKTDTKPSDPFVDGFNSDDKGW